MASKAEADAPPSSTASVAAAATLAKDMSNIFWAVGFYWVISISMVFVNKTLLSSPTGKIDAPFFITWYQCLVTVVAVYAMGQAGVANVPKFELRPSVVRQMVSLSVVFTSMIVFNNLCLKYVEVSFYQVARSLTIVFNVVFDFVVLGQVTSLPAIGCCALVVSGFLLGNDQELRWSLQGVVFGVASSFFVAMNSIMVKKKFRLVDNDPWKLTLYNNVNATILFLPLIVLSGEVNVVATAANVRTPQFWGLMTIGGFLGVAISFATAAQIKYTSPLTHNVSATAKAAAQTVLALGIYRNPITALGGLSVAVVLAGSLSYTLVRRAEMKSKAAAEEAARVAAAAEDNVRPLVMNEATRT